MKRIMILLIATAIACNLEAQTKIFPSTPRYEIADVEVTYDKTTMLLFPYAVKPGDVGSGEVIAQKVKGVDNAVKVKAARRNFAPTNLSVFTADGKLYALDLHYSDSVRQTVYVFGDNVAADDIPLAPAHSIGGELDQARMDSAAAGVLARRGFISHPAWHSEKVHAAVTGLYYADGMLFVRLKIRNRSFIPYEVDFARTAIETTGKGKRKVRVAESLPAVYQYGVSGDIVKGYARDILLVYPKFTLSHDRRLVIRLYEKQGHRDILLPVRAGTFSRARSVAAYLD